MCRADVDIWAKCYKFFALLGGGNWNNGVQAGARAVNLNNYPWNVNTNIGARCARDLVIIGVLLYGATAQLMQFTISQNASPVLTAFRRWANTKRDAAG